MDWFLYDNALRHERVNRNEIWRLAFSKFCGNVHIQQILPDECSRDERHDFQ